MSGARDAWTYILVAQLLNLLGFLYVAETARILFGASGATESWVALADGLFFVGHVPTDALNADQLLFPLWSGIMYHLLQGLRQGRWRDWIALGIVAGLSLLAKYFSAAFIIACVITLIWIPKFRGVFHDPRFYLAAVICAVLFLPTAIAVWLHQNTLRYGFAHFFLKPLDLGWLESIALFLVSPVLFGFPFAVGLLVTVQRKAVAKVPGSVVIEHIPGATRKVSDPFSTFSYQMTFVVAFGLNGAPTWKFKRLTVNPSSPLFNTSLQRTQDLTITIGKTAPATKNNPATPSPQMIDLHTAALIGQAVATAIQSQTH